MVRNCCLYVYVASPIDGKKRMAESEANLGRRRRTRSPRSSATGRSGGRKARPSLPDGRTRGACALPTRPPMLPKTRRRTQRSLPAGSCPRPPAHGATRSTTMAGSSWSRGSADQVSGTALGELGTTTRTPSTKETDGGWFGRRLHRLTIAAVLHTPATESGALSSTGYGRSH